MSDELPQGWASTTLGEVCSKPQYGWTCKASKEGTLRYLRTTDISGGKIDWSTVPFCSDAPEDINKYRIQVDDILVSRAGSVGVSYRITDIPFDAVFASYLIRFKPLADIQSKWVELFLRSDSYWRSISEFSAGIAIPNVNASKLALLEMPLAPAAEQQRIVAKLEEVLGRTDACNARLAKIPVLLKRFRQSILAAACSGRLTADWREENPATVPYPCDTIDTEEELPTNWRATSLGRLTTLVTSGSRGWAEYYAETGSTFIRAQNINSDYLNMADIAYVRPPAGAEGLRTRVRQHDLLVTITGANVTKSALVEIPIEDAYISQHVALARLQDVRLSKFVFQALICPSYGRKQLLAAAYGQGKPGLNLENIRDVVINLPPLTEQQEIVRRVEALFALADKIEARFKQAKAQVDRLTPSILARAFAGKLVLQDPADEPASILLERIRAGKGGIGDPALQKDAYPDAMPRELKVAEPPKRSGRKRAGAA